MDARLGVRTAKRLAYHGGVLALARLARRRERAIVLRYHAVTARDRVDYAAPSICMPVDAFRRQMEYVRRAYRVVPLPELVAAVAHGGTLPSGALAITFDDGYADNYTLAFPVLRQLGLPATVYVSTGCTDDAMPFWVSAVRVLALRGVSPIAVRGLEPIGVSTEAEREALATTLTRTLVPLEADDRATRLREAAEASSVDLEATLKGAMLSGAQIRELSEHGWTIGGHTVTHGNVTMMPPAVVERELGDSAAHLEALTGAPVEHFCYPNTGGKDRYFAPEVAETLSRLGYRSATTSRPGAIRIGADPFFLPRLGVSPRLTHLPELASAVERHRLAA